jgi:hypothetical protein
MLPFWGDRDQLVDSLTEYSSFGEIDRFFLGVVTPSFPTKGILSALSVSSHIGSMGRTTNLFETGEEILGVVEELALILDLRENPDY